jgi:hypothetical protein
MALQAQLGLLLGVAGAGADHTTVTWTTPTVEPQHNTKDQAVISGGMPVGNGETALLVFPLVPPVPVPTCTFEPGVDYSTGLGQSVQADSKEACCAECMGSKGCAAAVWKGGKTCWLKQGPLHKSPNSNPAVTACVLPPNSGSSAPPAVVSAPPPPCKGTLVGGTYCDMGKFIGCHDMSCQLKGEQQCAATTMAACELEVAKDCDKTPTCVAFSIMKLGSTHFTYELAHNTGCVLHGFPDSDWAYFVQAKPWPVPSSGGCHAPKPKPPPPPPGPVSMGNFTLPNSVSFLVNMATAMASDTSLFKLGMVSLITGTRTRQPPPPAWDSPFAWL